MKLDELITASKIRLDKLFAFYLKDQPSPAPLLQQAMAYAVFNGGKRIRPLLVYVTGRALNADWETCDAAACAMEFIHAYSLIHDDLPAMDNADLRRGKPSCHKAFDEALAILAGDTLQSLAFEVLAKHPAPLTTEQRLAMVHTLSHASGLHGMAAGQALDLANTSDLIEMYHLKTGALLIASVKLGAIAANIQMPSVLSALEIYARNIGTAFQIQDDLLDYEQATTTGKPQGLDAKNLKTTYPGLVGLEKTQMEIERLFASALKAIEPLGEKAGILCELANSLLQRKQ